jgi:hypothetical protein
LCTAAFKGLSALHVADLHEYQQKGVAVPVVDTGEAPMRTLRIVLGTLLVGAVALVVGAGPVSGASGGPVTYSGEFNGYITYFMEPGVAVGTCPTTAQNTASGTWSVTVHGTSASAGFDIKVNSADHVAYTIPKLTLAYSAGGTKFVAYGQTGAGVLTLTLFDSGRFTYRISPYNNTGLGLPGSEFSCDMVTFNGSADD